MGIKVNGTKKITDLIAVDTINDADVFMIETTNGSRKVTGSTLKSLINNAADDVVSIIGTEFDANESYSIGDYVTYGGKLYKFTSSHQTGAFDGTDAEEVTIVDEMVNDVTINGTSIVSDGVANIPYASSSTYGVVKPKGGGGTIIDSVDGTLVLNPASSSLIKSGAASFMPVVPQRQHESVFFGLAKAAGDTTQSQSANVVGTYTDEAKSAIKEMLGFATPDDVSAVDFSDRIKKGTTPGSLIVGDINVHTARGANSFVSGGFLNSIITISGNAGATTYTYSGELRNYTIERIGLGGVVICETANIPNDPTYITSIDTTNKTITVSRTLSETSNYTDTLMNLICGSIALANNSHVEGSGNVVNDFGVSAHAEGMGNIIKGIIGHAEGVRNIASGAASHVEGSNNTAASSYSHAEGYGTTASTSNAAHAEGTTTIASGLGSHAEGTGTTASGDYSHSEGSQTIANSAGQHVMGVYNIEDPGYVNAASKGTYVEIVGNGTGDNNQIIRSNARTLDWSGNEWLAGTLKIGGTSYADATEVATVTDVDNVDFTDRLTKVSTDSLSLTGKLTVGTNPINSMDVVTKSYMDNVVAETALGGVEVTVSGTTPTITASANTRYICGEVTTLSVTPPEFGTTEVIFESGSTPTVLTLPAAVMMPEWFTVQSGYTYQISITNNKYGAVMMWQS